ncbi:DUF805 domain-containing protein [Isoptericola sp. NPDC056578]|uniref:DUF805 domain-containing protein n=1 Tax=Isoptericola sp. NPDC056578 TaxID=3345870 RepID=UPI00369933A7
MSPIAAISSVFRRYAVFSGRARRAEYWWFVVLRAVVIVAVGVAINARTSPSGVPERPSTDVLVAVLLVILLACLLPDLAVTARRLHDTGLSGMWLLLWLVPGLGALAVFLMTVLPGDRGPNRFGPDPRAHRGGAVAARHAVPASL